MKYLSEQGTVGKLDDKAKYNTTCISCGDTGKIEMWPMRNGHDDMIGMIFLCRGCCGLASSIAIKIEGIRGHGEEER